MTRRRWLMVRGCSPRMPRDRSRQASMGLEQMHGQVYCAASTALLVRIVETGAERESSSNPRPWAVMCQRAVAWSLVGSTVGSAFR
jgi:hypothetical protein